MADLGLCEVSEMEAFVRRQLGEVYTPEGVEVWLAGHNRSLGGERAIDLIDRGEGERVLAVIERLTTGAFS
jgi:hypothetical protein